MRQQRTLTPIVFVLFLLAWPALVHADFQAGVDAYNQGDYATALKEMRPLAEQGDAAAQFNLGILYDNGYGVPQDDQEAVRWWRPLAEQGDADAQFNLGVMYDKGQGVPQDDAQARDWYLLAADQGHALAQAKLGLVYREGRGVLQDYVQAHMWYNLAAARNQEDATELRDSLAEQMTPAQILTLQESVE